MACCHSFIDSRWEVTQFAQSYREEFAAPDRVSLSLKNRDGRVSIIASDEQQNKVNDRS